MSRLHRTQPEPGEEPELWREFVDWYCDPQREGSQAQWGRDHGINDPSRITAMKREPRIMQMIEDRYRELNVNPERVQKVIDAMYSAATAGDVKAATLYLQFAERLQPTQRIVVEDRREEGLSDEDLDAEIRALVDA
jgi:hypothetical protein